MPAARSKILQLYLGIDSNLILRFRESKSMMMHKIVLYDSTHYQVSFSYRLSGQMTRIEFNLGSQSASRFFKKLEVQLIKFKIEDLFIQFELSNCIFLRLLTQQMANSVL